MAYKNWNQDYSSSYTLEYFILSNINKMSDAHANGYAEKRWKYFESTLPYCVSLLEADIRKEIERDYRLFLSRKADIKLTKENENTKKLKLAELKDSFINAHQYFIGVVLGKVGNYAPKEDGIVDLEGISINEYSKIVRNDNNSVRTNLERYEEKATEKDSPGIKKIKKEINETDDIGESAKLDELDESSETNERDEFSEL